MCQGEVAISSTLVRLWAARAAANSEVGGECGGGNGGRLDGGKGEQGGGQGGQGGGSEAGASKHDGGGAKAVVAIVAAIRPLCLLCR